MKVADRYFSRVGNTKNLAKAVSEAAGVPALPVSQNLKEDVDILFFCSALYAGHVDPAVKKFIRENHSQIGKVVNISISSSNKSTYPIVKELFAEQGIPLAREEYHCRGSFMFFRRKHPDEEDLAELQKFVRDIVS